MKNGVIFAFAAVGGLSGLASAFLLPWFPNLCREQGLNRWETGCIFAALDLSLLLFRWPMIELCKRWNHRSCFFCGYLIQTICCFCLGFSWTLTGYNFFAVVLVLRAVQGFGAAMVSAAALSVMIGLQQHPPLRGHSQRAHQHTSARIGLPNLMFFVRDKNPYKGGIG